MIWKLDNYNWQTDVFRILDENARRIRLEVSFLDLAPLEDRMKYARIVAAAPELLEALRQSRAQWIHSVNAEKCLAAIAKATKE